MLSVYLKPTNFCNVGCEHCYLPKEVRANKDKMSDEKLHEVASFIKEAKTKGGHEQVFIIWHGGEPLMLPPEYFENAGNILNKYFEKDELIEAMQTSLIPYKRTFSDIALKRWRGEIGSSIDFSTRTFKGLVSEYQKLWLSKVDLAREDNILVLPGMVPSKNDCVNYSYIYDWFKKHDFWIWNIDRYTDVGGISKDFSSNYEHSSFLIGLFDKVIIDIEKTGQALFIKTIAAVIRGILYDMPGDRWGGTCQSDFIVINPDGKLNNCPDKDSFEESYGNISSGYKSFFNSPLRKKWIRIQQVGHKIDECYTCENASWCKSGCPITGNACIINGVVDECSGYKRFITHVRNFMKNAEGLEIVKKYINFDFMPKGLSKEK